MPNYRFRRIQQRMKAAGAAGLTREGAARYAGVPWSTAQGWFRCPYMPEDCAVKCKMFRGHQAARGYYEARYEVAVQHAQSLPDGEREAYIARLVHRQDETDARQPVRIEAEIAAAPASRGRGRAIMNDWLDKLDEAADYGELSDRLH